MYHMPLVATTGLLALLGVLTVIYLFFKGTYFTIKRWYLTNFDFATYISNWNFNTTLLDLSWQTLCSWLVYYLD